MDGDIFENAPRVDAGIFYADKKDAFSEISGYVCRQGLKLQSKLFWVATAL